jgi:hypothetical protein
VDLVDHVDTQWAHNQNSGFIDNACEFFGHWKNLLYVSFRHNIIVHIYMPKHGVSRRR